MFDKLWKTGKVAILLVSLVMFVSWLPELIPNYIDDHFNKGEGGIVIVDSPEVYSRERMINDRFREVSWLEYELEQSASRQFGTQAISRQQKTLRLDTKIGITNTGNENEDSSLHSGDTLEAAPNKSNPDVSVSPGERFRDIRAYREEIRTEMMETLLDDRHDIKGNTLYRLKFDTTVLPQQNTDKLAVIQVKLKRANFCNPDATADGYQLKDSEHLPCISIRAIHDAWLRQTEEKINDAVEGTMNDFIGMRLETRNFAELVRFLQARVPDETGNEEILPAQHIDIWNNFKRYHPSCEGQARTDAPKQSIKRSVDNNFKKRVFATKSCPPVPVSRFFAFNPDPQVRGPDPQIIGRYTQLRKLLLRYYSEHLGMRSIRTQMARRNPRNFTGTSTGSLKIYSDFEAAHAKFDDPKFADLSSDLKNQSNKWMSPLLLEESTKFKFPDISTTDPEKIIDQAEKIIGEARKIVAETESAELALLRYAIVGMWIDKYTYSNQERQEECKKLFGDKLEVFDPKSLSCLAHIEKTDCKNVNYCTIRVEARIPSKRKEIIDDTTMTKGKAHLWSQIRETFKRLLRIDEVYYSYAVTPKERAQRVLTIASERRQKQLALSLIASAGGELDQATISSLTSAISDSGSQIEQIQRRPLILSFGRGQPVIVDSGTGDSNTAGKDEPKQRGIDFGWVIGPKYMFSDGSDNKINFYHAPVQNSLSAIISVPSWWTTINLEINTCWIAQDQLTKLKETKVMRDRQGEKRSYVIDFCNPEKVQNIHNVDADYLVRLPGSTEELPRKFGYEIERVPSMSDGGVVADFYVGQENASLIIQGNELWRSTVVTMGNQKANKIEVLPNMKGIIATFSTIASPSQKIESDPGGRMKAPTKCFVLSEVLVWTSEGRTHEGQIFARIHANPLLNPKIKPSLEPDASSDRNTQYPKGFGDCARTPQKRSKPDGQQNAGAQNQDQPVETSDPT